MAYSTEAQLKANVALLEKTYKVALTLTAVYTANVVFADKAVKMDCGNIIDFGLVPDDALTPSVNLLSQYKTAEITLVRLGAVKRNLDTFNDIQYWQKEYNDLKNDIASGKVPVYLADGVTSALGSTATFTSTANNDETINPYFGDGKYGQPLSADDLTDARDSINGENETVDIQ